MKNNAYQESINSAPKVSGEIRLSEPRQANEKEKAFLEEIENKEIGPDDLTNEICDFLEKEGKPGSAEYVRMFSESVALHKELKELYEGKEISDPKMVDPKTSKEMVKEGKAFLKDSASSKLLSSANKLQYKLSDHISKTAQKASDYYADEYTRKKSLKDIFVKEKSKPQDIPLLLNEQEVEKINELSDRKFLTQVEMKQTFQNELNFMMKKRPGMIGLKDSERLSKKLLPEVIDDLGGVPTEPKNVEKVSELHDYMSFYCPKELDINPGFLSTIEKA